jgi:CcmD family protein
MPADSTTFFAAFAAIALCIGAYLWHLDRKGRMLEARLATLEAARQAVGAANQKKGDGEPRRRA